jgi:hypothetical protein
MIEESIVLMKFVLYCSYFLNSIVLDVTLHEGRPDCAQRLCFCSSALPKPRPVPDTKRGTKITLIAYTSPRYCRSILLAVVGPFRSLHSKPCLSSPVNVTPLLIIRSCGGAFFIDYFLHLHLTEHTLWLALDAGCKCGQTERMVS